MGDVGDYWRDAKDYRREQKEKRAPQDAQRCKDHIQHLRNLGCEVKELNPNGPHLRINGKVNYWPSTGKWTVNNSSIRGHGFKNLIKHFRTA